MSVLKEWKRLIFVKTKKYCCALHKRSSPKVFKSCLGIDKDTEVGDDATFPLLKTFSSMAICNMIKLLSNLSKEIPTI